MKENLTVTEKILTKYKIFSVSTTKEVKKIDENGEEIMKTVFCKLQFVKSTRFMASSSNLVDNLAEGIHKIKCKYEHDNKKCQTCGINYKDCECGLQYTNIEDYLIEYKYMCYNKNYLKRCLPI